MCVDPWYPIGPILSIFWGFSLLSDRASRWPLDAGHHRREIVRLLLLLGQVRLLEAKGHRRDQLNSHPSHLLQPGMDPLLRRAIPVLTVTLQKPYTFQTLTEFLARNWVSGKEGASPGARGGQRLKMSCTQRVIYCSEIVLRVVAVCSIALMKHDWTWMNHI